MSYTIINDNGVLQIRVSIVSREELNVFIKAMERERENFPEFKPAQTEEIKS